MNAAQPVLRAEGFGRRFGRRRVLGCASLWLRPGRITALFGTNGSGKSTLLRVITGLVRADYGVLHFAGEMTERPRLHELARRGMFYLPERGVLSHLLALDRQLALFAGQFQRSAARVDEVLETMALSELREGRPTELSPGERLRASFALALLREPSCLLADEAFLGSAPLHADLISAALRELQALGCAICVTGHETPVLLEIADEVVWLTGGATHVLGSPAAARRHSQFRREYLALG
jgi:ABC-type multidrug transport system ATPase subunit